MLCCSYCYVFLTVVFYLGAVIHVPFKPKVGRVRQILKGAGLFCCRAAHKPLLTTVHIRRRLSFATDHATYDFRRVIFSDEKKFRFRACGVVRVWRQRGDRFKPEYTVPTVGQNDGLMVWAAMNAHGDVIVRQCPTSVDSAGYQAILATALHFIRPRCV